LKKIFYDQNAQQARFFDTTEYAAVMKSGDIFVSGFWPQESNPVRLTIS